MKIFILPNITYEIRALSQITPVPDLFLTQRRKKNTPGEYVQAAINDTFKPQLIGNFNKLKGHHRNKNTKYLS